MEPAMSTYTDEILEKTLYLCDNLSCGRYYVLNVALDSPAQKCPKSESHGFMTKVDKRARCWGWNTCGNQECESYLSSAVDTDGGKCAKCKRPVITVSQLEVEELPVYEEGGESGGLPSVIRSMKSEAAKSKDWKTSHHSDYTSTGKKKSGTSQARERHTQADRQNKLQATKKIDALNGVLTAAITWRVTHKGPISPAVLKEYKSAVMDLRRQISRLGGTAVTETSVKTDLGIEDDEDI
jgi:hypothetical protein